MPSQNVYGSRHGPKELAAHSFEFDFTQDLGWSWRHEEAGNVFTSAALANYAVELLLDMQKRVDEGELR